MAASKAIQIILTRQLASCVAMPILLIDAEGTLIYYNEPAEALLNQRFDETGEIPAREWHDLVDIADDDRHPIPLEDRPMMAALTQRLPIARSIWVRGGSARAGNGGWRHVSVIAFPLVGESGQLLGATSIFWEI
jgi:PAS domain-containing protein